MRSISSHVSKSWNLQASPATTMPLSTPWPSTIPCPISRFTSSPMLVPRCAVHVKQTTTTATLLSSPRQPPSRSCCPSAPQQSHDPQHLTNLCCPSASHAVTCATSPRHTPKCTSALHTCAQNVNNPPPPSHASAYQVNLLQALESSQVHAQQLSVVVIYLLQRVV
jgi:hypothetical protein